LKNKITIALLVLFTPFLISVNKVIACENGAENSKCVQISVKGVEGNAATGMVVYLQPLDGQVLKKSTEKMTVSQQGTAFSPYITVSQTDTEVNFANKDDITHQIYSADSENKFSFTIRAGEDHLSKKFNDESEIAMGCNIHDWMSGYLLIVDTPYFGKTDDNGEASFSVAELGKYRVVVWHPQLPTAHHRVSQEHNIVSDAVFNFSLNEKLEEIPTQKNEDDFDFNSDY